MGNWIQLTSGGGYDFEKREIFGRYSLERDLVWPLAGENRYARHTVLNWPVAIHSVAVARCIWQVTGDLDAAAAGLLHDAHESVLGDIPTPVAWAIDYEKVSAVKEEVQLAIEDRLQIPDILRPLRHIAVVKLADAAALHVERQMFMPPESRDWRYKVPGGEWTQPMWDIVVDILKHQEHTDGGYDAFLAEYHAFVERR